MMLFLDIFGKVIFVTASIMFVLNFETLKAKFQEMRIRRKNRRTGWDVYAIVENARRREK